MTRIDKLRKLYSEHPDYSRDELVDTYQDEYPDDDKLSSIRRQASLVIESGTNLTPSGSSKVLIKTSGFRFGRVEESAPEGYRLKQVLPRTIEREGRGKRKETEKNKTVMIVWEKIER